MLRPEFRAPLAAIAAFSTLLGACTGNVEGVGPSATSAGMAGTVGSGGASASGNAGATARAGTGGGVASGGALGSAGSGGSGALGGSGAVVPEPPPFEPAPGMLRRLTRAQFRNAVRDVFGVEVNASELDADSWNGNFATVGASTVVTAELGVEQYHAAIEQAAEEVFADAARRSDFMGCTPTGAAGDACLRGFVEELGRRAWRRPLDTVEVARLLDVAATADSELDDPVEGARWATIAIFTSPNFLYRSELGAASSDGSLRFTGYETAARLAFLVWNSLPDRELLDQAESQMLATPDGIRAAVERMLDEPRGREAVGGFAEEYLRLDRIATQGKDPSLFPEYGTALQAAMVRDMRETWETIAFEERKSVLELFTTAKVVANAELAQLYGLDTTGLDSNTFKTFSLPADGPRLGILSKPGFLSQFANQKEGSPTLRGKFMREALMCTPIEPPPGDVDVVLEDPPADQPMTKRQRLEAHRVNPRCAGCHSMMDPLGLPFENFDAIGRYRTTDHGLPIDPSGDFDERPVADARELGVVLASSETVSNCLVRKYYTYAVGHLERDVDGSVLNELAASFAASGYQMRDLIVELVTHPAFSSVAPAP